MKKLHVLSYDLIITGQFDDSKRIVITIGDAQDHEAAILAADITNFIMNRDYVLSKSRRESLKEEFIKTAERSEEIDSAIKDIYHVLVKETEESEDDER